MRERRIDSLLQSSGTGPKKRGKKNLILPVILLVLLIISVFSSVQTMNATSEGKEAQILTRTPTNDALQTFKPTMQKPQWLDQNNNCIVDTLDEEIAQRTINDTQHDYTDVIVMLKNSPTLRDTETFTEHNGYVTTDPWTQALYGFAGHIQYNQITIYIEADPNVLLIEKQQACNAHIAYAARQIGARTYVWNNLSLQGDPQSSIAILDTGLDDSHPDFAPGYGSLNFSKKIVGWNDQIGGAAQPYDDNGHGSHVAGLAAGNGFFSADASGYATATWGANLGTVGTTGTYLISGMMVNRSGPITIKAKWTNTATGGRYSTVSAVQIYYGDKTLDTSLWVKVAETTTAFRDTWYTLTYTVPSNPPNGYDMYHVTMTLTAGGKGNLYIAFTMAWPYNPPQDGFAAWTGIAPQTKLVSVKALDYSGSGTSAGLINGVNWIIANKENLHIVVASMSLGFTAEVQSVNQAIINLVNSGITTIVSAGNGGPNGNFIHTPGSVDEALTVAATNQFDNIADYSSEGGTSYSTGNTIKPDIAAPGGSFLAVPLMSADSNDYDAEGKWIEAQPNDAAPMQGTSMSTPVVSGAASLVIQAMGGFSSWQWTRTQALQPKMILLMTATETYPLDREYYPAYSPTLQRGGKDEHEGYGRLNLDAALDALLKTYQVGTTISDTLGRPPAISDISTLGQKLAWARNVHLQPGAKYNFTLTVPTGADFDLYLYNSTGTHYGEPAIVQKSTTAATGGREQIILDNAPYNGAYYLVVKRATAATGPGTFTLQSTVTPSHEISTLTVEPMPTVVYPIDPVNITVTVKNKGLNTETFNVTVYYNATAIATQTVLNLPPNNTTALNFTWNTIGVTPSHYVIKAQADPVPNEYNPADNTATYSGTVTVKIPGDVDNSNSVDNTDLLQLRVAYASTVSSVNWNPECDFNRDNIIDAVDLFTLGKNYG
jgi:subtilisin family serine protease